MIDPITSSVSDQALASFHEHGFCRLEALFDAAEVAALSCFDVSHLRRLAREQPEHAHRIQLLQRPDGGGEIVQKIEAASEVEASLRRISTDPRLLAAVEALMGETPRLFKDKYILKASGAPGFGAHQDMAMGFHRFTDRVISCMIAIDPADADNGCLEVASIAHTPSLLSRPEQGLDARLLPPDAWRAQPLQAGDVLCFDGLTPHRSAPNHSERDRRVYITTYQAASEAAAYHDYYDWYFAWQRHIARGGQRGDYPGESPQRSRPGVTSFAGQELEAARGGPLR